ncbi:hypothetical protein AB0J74_11085 [Asanoa sp. NPDC049573]|uniref:hypothetical protein n=1 Tax=Asanoa sp. NPDC049573 TaxID=3155396 RepID=UPI003419CEAC
METFTEPAGADRPRASRRATSRLAEGVADGFTEASQAFSDEVRGAATCTDLAENLFVGMLRANGRFLDELATTSRRFSAEVGRASAEEIDYDRLADLIASRLADPLDYDRLADMVAARLAARS